MISDVDKMDKINNDIFDFFNFFISAQGWKRSRNFLWKFPHT